MKEKICIFLSSILFLGCSPLEQAPLVYSSTATFGVSTGVNTTETLGFDIVLGYRQADAAYVPVAVAKKTDKCDQKDKDGAPVCSIMPIAASKSDLRTKSKTIPDEVKNKYIQLQTDIDGLKKKIIEGQKEVKSNLDQLPNNVDNPEGKLQLEDKIKSLRSSVESEANQIWI